MCFGFLNEINAVSICKTTQQHQWTTANRLTSIKCIEGTVSQCSCYYVHCCKDVTSSRWEYKHCLQDSSPTGHCFQDTAYYWSELWTLCLQNTLPIGQWRLLFGQFAYWTLFPRYCVLLVWIMDTLPTKHFAYWAVAPTVWSIRLLDTVSKISRIIGLNYGHFAYKTLRLLGSGAYCLVNSPTIQTCLPTS